MTKMETKLNMVDLHKSTLRRVDKVKPGHGGSMFVKWSCGCIGIHPSLRIDDGEGRKSVIVIACDDDSTGMCFTPRNQDSKPCKSYYPLTDNESLEICNRIGQCMADAQLYQDIRVALQLPFTG